MNTRSRTWDEETAAYAEEMPELIEHTPESEIELYADQGDWHLYPDPKDYPAGARFIYPSWRGDGWCFVVRRDS